MQHGGREGRERGRREEDEEGTGRGEGEGREGGIDPLLR